MRQLLGPAFTSLAAIFVIIATCTRILYAYISALQRRCCLVCMREWRGGFGRVGQFCVSYPMAQQQKAKRHHNINILQTSSLSSPKMVLI